jgi:hypothetical protein
MKLIGVAGFARSGKDTVASYLVRNHGYTRLAFADPMREMLFEINPIVSGMLNQPLRVQEVVKSLGWDEAKVKIPEVRELLQRLGTDAGRKVLGQTIWLDTILKKINSIEDKVVISDVRFEDECEFIRVNGGKVIRVFRPNVTSVNNHVSDKWLPDACIDHEIRNDGSIADLEIKVAEYLNSL